MITITNWKNTTPPEAPFYAVIFISRKSENLDGYATTDAHMMELAQQQAGYLGYTSQSGTGGDVFISYWKTEEHIAHWQQNEAHKVAKSKARQWYSYFHSMVCKVESSLVFDSFLKQHL